ncbi:hypothetical protein DFQ30_007893 [Apophysomyces sp. BC1015]|nr:hypothetical protein DFQ30_007893 [Apophysomyces sp. BC1015]
MDRKARSKPMRHILNRLLAHGDFEIVIFGDKTILDEAIQYTKLRKPFTVNNVCMQSLLWDRRVVLSILDAIEVPTPPRLIVSRDGGVRVDPDAAKAFKDCTGMDMNRVVAKCMKDAESVHVTSHGIEADGKFLPKTFIEKPTDGEDHNINIYYSHESGGGGRRLFRKVYNCSFMAMEIGNKSSEYDPTLDFASEEGSWIYEELMETENCEDIKLYTVGPTFVHAETRKSPTVDGLVKRNTDGKEIRYCTELTQEEEEIARKVSRAFGQTVCGLDLLRVGGKSYVIDVNGWSFVKGNDHYYDMCARLLSEAFLRSVQRRPSMMIDAIPPEIAPENSWRLKGFVAVFRHGDRTPKEKLKVSVKARPFVDLLDGSTQEVVFRQKHQLALFAKAVDECLEKQLEEEEKLRGLKEVLAKKWELPGTKVQLKPQFDKETGVLKKLHVNVKWGGEFTHAGLHQSRDLGENLRKDMNIMNRNIMDDVKIFSSSERRVRATADVFARWFLGQPESIEGVISESKYLLDDSNAAKENGDAVKHQLRELVRPGSDIPALVLTQMGWPVDMPQPHVVLQEISAIMTRMQRLMYLNWASKDVDQLQRRWCCFESPTLFRERWEKMFRKFCDESNADESDDTDVKRQVEVARAIDPSWIPELYDMLKYDSLHNRPFLQAIFSDVEAEAESGLSNGSRRASSDLILQCGSDLRILYKYVKLMFDFIAPEEFGISDAEKKNIGMLISLPLLKSILRDLDDMKSADNPKTRLYFTKESHVHALLNLVYHSGVPTKEPRNALPELDCAHYDSVLDLHMDAEHCLKVAPRKNLIPHLSLEEVLAYHKGYLNVPNLESIERQIEERKLHYAQEDNQ